VILRLWYLQVIQGHYYALASERNRMRHLDVRASRGLILDREGLPLLENRATYDLAITPQYLSRPNETLDTLKHLLDFTQAEIAKIKKQLSLSPQFLPLVIKKNLSFQEAAIVETHKFFLTGLDVITSPNRWYKSDEQAHLIGHLGEISQKEIMEFNRISKSKKLPPYKLGALVGKNGIEKQYEIFLRGQEGQKLIQVDAHGRLYTQNTFRISQLYQDVEAVPGHNVVLTISKKLQESARKIFQDHNGALVALDVNTSEVLAYISQPNYDLNLYVNGISAEDWLALRTNPNKPLIDKVSSGVYAPGSVYKVITAIAGLQEKIITPSTTFNCPGSFSLGRGHWRCWKRTGHGPVNIIQALERSCDVFFYNLGHLVGAQKLAFWAEQFGLGQKTGFELNTEHSGLNPTQEWKRQASQGDWHPGDTINMSIGQGYVLVTPLQVANLYAAIANGGHLHRPFVTKSVLSSHGQIIFSQKPELIRTIPIEKSYLDLIKQSLFQVVNAPLGTAKRAQAPYGISGKTGTSENISAQIDKATSQENLPMAKRDHGWFVGYAPSQKPEIVIAVLSENAGGGGKTAAPVAKELFDVYFEAKKQSQIQAHSR
jgi:penicillin-binding protein 2